MDILNRSLCKFSSTMHFMATFDPIPELSFVVIMTPAGKSSPTCPSFESTKKISMTSLEHLSVPSLKIMDAKEHFIHKVS